MMLPSDLLVMADIGFPLTAERIAKELEESRETIKNLKEERDVWHYQFNMDIMAERKISRKLYEAICAVVSVADRATDEFDLAREAIVEYKNRELQND